MFYYHHYHNVYLSCADEKKDSQAVESYQHYLIYVIIIFHRLGLLCEINFVRGLSGLVVSGGRFFLPKDLLIFDKCFSVLALEQLRGFLSRPP